MNGLPKMETTAVTEYTPVLIVGGALTGLSSALFLAWHGVPCVVVERHPDLLIHPRLRGLTPRTVELYRQVGLEPAIRAASYASSEQLEWIAVRAETLASETYLPAAERGDADETASASPCAFGAIDQDRLEMLLRERARELGADIRFAIELVSFEQDDGGVTVLLRDRRTGVEHALRADYLIAADGASSGIRQQLEIDLDGPGLLFHAITAMIEADLTPALRGRRVSIAYLERPQPYTLLMAHDDAGQRWIFGTGYDPALQPVETFTDERVAALVREAAGLTDLEVTLFPQIPGTDRKVLGFAIGAQVARRYRVGRIFLAGDSAHLVPPTGGFGGNAGVQDTHNLAWKLAMVLRGQASPALLDTYEVERRPVGILTMQQALARFGARMGPGAEMPLIDYAAVAMGYRYRSAAVAGAPDDDTPVRPRELSGQPGTRAPHLSVARDGREISSLDLYGRRFVLLAGPAGASWMAAAERIAARVGIALDAYRFGVELGGADGTAAHGIGPDGALLVRPDGFVAWRNEAGAEEPERELERALARILGRASQAPSQEPAAG